MNIGPSDHARVQRAGIRILTDSVRGMNFEDGGCVTVTFQVSVTAQFGALYSGLGITPQTGLAATLGLELTEDQCIVTDIRQRRSVPEVFAAGDAVTGLTRSPWPWRMAKIAAVTIHNGLRQQEGRCLDG